MAKKELWEYPFVRFMLNLWRGFGITPRKPDKTSLKTAVQLLKAGRVVCVYPEGGVTREPPLSPLLPGITLIARQAKATVMCLGINGTNTVMPLGETKMRPGDPIVATWGEPMPELYQRSPEEMLRWIREELLRLSGHE
jgi:1-acyl-sn-glycerol-3-phosphate acyltransferase